LTALLGDGIDAAVVEHGGVRELFATALPAELEDPASLHQRLRNALAESGAEILEMRVFGSVDEFEECAETLRRLYGGIDWPLVFIQGHNCFGGELAGIQLHAVSGSPVETIYGDDRPIGRAFEDQFARYLVLGNLHSSDSSRPREVQTQDTFGQMVAGLAAVGMDLHSIVRTWFYVDDILGWYQDFNRVRSEIYAKEGVFERYLPASTGIGGSNPQNTAVVASVMAMQAKAEGVAVREIPSPLQCPAIDYGSSFTRAAEVVTPDSRSVLVSGTASIDPEGATAHLGDVEAQVAYTLKIVEAILKSRGMDFGDVTRGNAYFKDSVGAATWGRNASRLGLPLSRVVVSENHVCRHDLLFELEIDATIVV
jgi:enamine deaminase RidA (YjgF/YER057c/UK114 family)